MEEKLNALKKITFVKINKIGLFTFKLKYNEPFRISLGETREKEGVFVQLVTQGGVMGFGEAAPSKYVTGETVSSCLEAISRHLFPAIKDVEANDLELIHQRMEKSLPGNPAAKAALDMALYDISSKASKRPLFKYLNGRKNKIETDITIGIDSPPSMARSASKFVNDGFQILKIKVGTTPEEDTQRIKLIRDAIGPKVKLRIDANQGWKTPQEALKIINKIRKYNIELIEQPLPASDIDGLRELRKGLIPIAADESAKSLEDVKKLIEKEAVDIINIKLMKCGGIYPAREIVRFCEKNNVPCMIGVMGESKIGVSAATHLACSSDIFKYADLDGDLLIEEKLVKEAGLYLKDGWRILKDIYGLGIVEIYSTSLTEYGG